MLRGVLFDLEETVWTVEEDPSYQDQAKRQMAALAGWQSARAFYTMVEGRFRRYREWAGAERKEAGDFELWRHWLLPEMDEARLRMVCHDLTAHLRQTHGRRKTAPGALRTVRTLYDRGYRLGIVSNSTGEREIPGWLEENGVKQYFETAAVSSVCHVRKPDPAIYRLACGEMGLEPEECASVSGGDFEGERAAGIGAVILLAGAAGQHRPDYTVDRFPEILELPVLRRDGGKEEHCLC